MKKGSTAAAKQRSNFSQQNLTIGLDLGDRSSWYCVLDERGRTIARARVRGRAHQRPPDRSGFILSYRDCGRSS